MVYFGSNNHDCSQEQDQIEEEGNERAKRKLAKY